MPIDPRSFLISVSPVSHPSGRHCTTTGTDKWMFFAEHACGMYWAHAGVLKAPQSGMVMAQGASTGTSVYRGVNKLVASEFANAFLYLFR